MAADRLRDLIDLVVASLDEPADGPALAARAHFSRDHLDRLLAAATGESPVALRRRLLLERAAWQLRAGAAPGEVAAAAGYGSAASFSRAFARAHGMPPARFATSGAPVRLAAPNGIHFHPPAGLLLPAGAGAGDRRGDLTERLVAHHVARVRELLEIAAKIDPEQLSRPLRPGFVVNEFEGEEADAATSPGSRGACATPAPGRTASSTRSASRRSPSPTAVCWRTSSPPGRSGPRRSPACCASSARGYLSGTRRHSGRWPRGAPRACRDRPPSPSRGRRHTSIRVTFRPAVP